jgi:multiple antibiotic resistance protein
VNFFLLAFPALFSIINPLGGAFIFLGATRRKPKALRNSLARWVAFHTFLILNISIYVGAYLLSFFGISMPVLRVAGGIIIAVNGFRMLNEGDDTEEKEEALEEAGPEAGPKAAVRSAAQLAFFPLTLPITAGPGTIAVAVALGSNRPRGLDALWFAAAATATTVVMCALVWVMSRYSDRISRAVGPTGTTIIVRLSAFILFCIGIQVLWSGVEELLRSVRAV